MSLISIKRSAAKRSAPKRQPKLATALGGGALATLLGGIAYSALVVPHELPLPNAVSGERRELSSATAGQLSYYTAGEGEPLLLIHSINAAASSYEVRPIYEHYAPSRKVYALDLPGFGFSERSDRSYTPRLFTDAVLAMVEEIQRETGAEQIDALALSLSSEFLARAASERPEAFRSLALVSPTAFSAGDRYYEESGSTRGIPALQSVYKVPLWSQAFFDGLNSRASQRYYLGKTFGSEHIDKGLLEYSYQTAHQPGARFAPLTFISGTLFSADIDRVYDQLDMPVWLAHGTHGDFQDYTGVGKVQNRPNWKVREFPTGALPHFELLDVFTSDYDAFLNR